MRILKSHVIGACGFFMSASVFAATPCDQYLPALMNLADPTIDCRKFDGCTELKKALNVIPKNLRKDIVNDVDEFFAQGAAKDFPTTRLQMLTGLEIFLAKNFTCGKDVLRNLNASQSAILSKVEVEKELYQSKFNECSTSLKLFEDGYIKERVSLLPAWMREIFSNVNSNSHKILPAEQNPSNHGPTGESKNSDNAT